MTSHKNGNIILSMILLIVILVAFGFISILAYQAFSETKTDIYSEMTTNESRTILDETETRYPSMVDGLILFLLIGFWVIGIVSALMSSNHPILFIFMFIGVIFVIIAGLFLSNFYDDFMQDDSIAGLSVQFPSTTWILGHLLTLGIVIATTMAIAYFAASRSG